jgi:hypothetical protein
MSDERFERDLGEVVRSLSGEDASPDLRARLAAVAERPASRRVTSFSAGWRIAATVAAAVALVALVSLFAPRLVGPQPASTPSAPPAEGAWTGLRWSAPVAPPDGTQVRDILAWGGEWVGVGVYQQSDTQTGGAAFLTSSDGTHWTVAYHYDALQTPTYLVPLGKGLLAVSDQGVMLGGCCSPPSLWQSDDGSTWYGIPPLGDWNVWIPDVHLVGVAGGSNGVVVIASGPDSTPVILHSTDGRTWTRVSRPPSFDHAILLDVTAFRDGFVVVGRDGQPDVPSNTGPTTPGLGKPAAWTSSDGLTWTAAQVEGSAVAGGELSAVVAGADGLFATGVDGRLPSDDATTGTWVSADGTSWRRITSSSAGVLPMIAGLAGDGQRMVRLAPQFAGSDGSGMAGWVTSDGVTWSRLAFSGAVTSLPLAATTAGGDPLGQVWVGPSGVIVNGQRTGALRFGAATGTLPPTPAPTILGLPVWSPGAFCDTAALIGPIHLDPNANPPTWVGDGSFRQYLEWPVGFSLREVNGQAALVDPSGQVVLTETHSYAGTIGGGVSQNRPGWFAVCEVGGTSYAKGR